MILMCVYCVVINKLEISNKLVYVLYYVNNCFSFVCHRLLLRVCPVMQKLVDSLGDMTSEGVVSNKAAMIDKLFSAIKTVNCVRFDHFALLSHCFLLVGILLSASKIVSYC